MAKGQSEASKKVSIVVPYSTYDKIVFCQKNERMRSFSAFVLKLIEEALERYPDPKEPQLPLR